MQMLKLHISVSLFWAGEFHSFRYYWICRLFLVGVRTYFPRHSTTTIDESPSELRFHYVTPVVER